MSDQAKIEEAIARVRTGDAEAFSDVVQETLVFLRSYARFFVSEAEAADDVVQEAYLLIYQQIGRYEPGSNFLAWAKAMVRNVALAALHQRKRESTLRDRYQGEIFVRVSRMAELADAEQPVEDRMQALRRCLARLADRARKLVEQHYLESRPLAEVARALGMNANSAAAALHRARAALARCMGASGATSATNEESK